MLHSHSRMEAHTVGTVVRSDNVPFSQLDDSFIAIDREAGYCYALNSTSGRIWEMISQPTPIESICDSLCREFDIAPETCLNDVKEFLSAMADAGLVSEWRG